MSARLMAGSKDGITIDEATKRAVEQRVPVEPLPPRSFKGKEGTIQVRPLGLSCLSV